MPARIYGSAGGAGNVEPVIGTRRLSATNGGAMHCEHPGETITRTMVKERVVAMYPDVVL